MKMLKKLLLLTLVIFTFTNCSSDDDTPTTVVTPTPVNIVETAQATADLSILVDAVIKADLVDALAADGDKTVLAPTNAAFTAFLQANGFESLDDVPVDLLTQVLLNHVIVGEIASTDLAGNTGYTTTLATGPGSTTENPIYLSIYYNGTNGVVFNGESTVETADVDATNGIIHIVDTVINLPTVTTFAVADSNFDTLQTALTTLTPATDFASILARTENNTDGINPNFTVFAPTNDAFAAITIPSEESTVTNILLHHVISGANVRSGDLIPNGTTVANTLNGAIDVTLPGTNGNIADVEDGSGNTDIGIIAVDVQAVNGVIHVVNKVLLPSL